MGTERPSSQRVVAVDGHCDPRFGPLRDAFGANFAERGEIGAAVCVMIDGHVVADLYGGWADQARGRRWQPDTLVNMFSVGKGLVAACTARLAGQGTLDLGADVHIGLPAAEHDRVATFAWPGPPPAETEPPGLSAAQLMEHNSYYNPGGLSGAGVINTSRWRAAESPSTNAHGTARGVARVYAALIGQARPAIVDPAALTEATAEQVYGQDLVLHRPSRFGLGFQLTQPERPIGPGRVTFGHFGAGGSLGFADPESGVGFGYVMNQMGPRWQNPRTRALVDAVYESLER